MDNLTFFSNSFSLATGKGLKDYDCITYVSLPDIPFPTMDAIKATSL